MSFRPQTHQQPAYYTVNGLMYDGLQALPTVSTPSPEFEYAVMAQVAMPHPHASPYALGSRHVSSPTPIEMSPVDQVQIEFKDLAAPYPEDLNYKPRKQDANRQPSASMHMRRRAQNRASQRAFRERKEKHTQDLQRRLTEVEQQYEQLKQHYDIVHKEKCQLEQVNRRCSCGSSIVASPGSVADSQTSDCGDSLDPMGAHRREAVSLDLADDADVVYEEVDWGAEDA